MSHMNEQPWESEEDRSWEAPNGSWEPDESESWRGDVHINDWPENLAGPEYWLYKQDNDDE